MKQALLALLFACLLVAFANPAQACEHAGDAPMTLATQAEGTTATPAPPAHCPPDGACNLHACCVAALAWPPQPQAKALDYTPASFPPLGVREPTATAPPTLDKPPKSQG